MKIDNINFTNINTNPIPKKSINGKLKYTQNDFSISELEIMPIVNAIEIDWNGAEVEDNVTINTTSDLLNWIKSNNGSDDIKGTVKDRLDILENEIGEGGSINEKIEDAKNVLIGDATSEFNSLGKVEDKIMLLQDLYQALDQSNVEVMTSVAWANKSSWQTKTIYRVQGDNSYADYMWDGTASHPIKMAEYNNAIDEKPTAESDNLVKSGGVYNELYEVTESEVTEDITASFQFTDNKGVLSSNGQLSSNTTYDSSYAHSNFVNIEGASKIKIRLPRKPQATSNIGVAFYTSNEDYLTEYFISGDKSDSGGSPSALYTQVKELIVPNDAKYIATSWFSSTLISQYGQPENPFLCEKTYAQQTGVEKYARNTALEALSDSMDGAIETIEDTLDNVVIKDDVINSLDSIIEDNVPSATLLKNELYEEVPYYTEVDLTNGLSFTDGNGVLASTGALSSAYDTYAYSNFIELPENAKLLNIRIPRKPLKSSNIGIAFYSSNVAGYASTYFISGVKSASGGSATAVDKDGYLFSEYYKYGDVDYPAISIPSEAKYVVMSWFSSSNIAAHAARPVVCSAMVENTSIKTKYAERKDVLVLNDSIVKQDEKVTEIARELKNGYVGMEYITYNSLNDAFLKYSSQRGAISGPRIALKPICKWGFAFQSTAIYNNIVIIVSNGENSTRCAIVDIASGKVLQNMTNMLPKDGTHHNSAVFLTEKYDENDAFPLLLIGGEQDDGENSAEAYIFRMQHSLENGYTLTKVSTIHLPLQSESFPNNTGALNFNKWNDKLLVEYRYTNSNNAQSIRMATFVMPTIGNNEHVYISSSDLLDDWQAYSTSFSMADSFVDGNYMYVGTTYGVYYYDLVNKQSIAYLNFYGTTLQKETESSFVYDGQLYFAQASGYNGIMLFDARND